MWPGARSAAPLDGAARVGVRRGRSCGTENVAPHDFVLAMWSTGKVGADIHVKVGKALYSVPWRLLGQQVDARTAGNTVQILHQGTVVATHPNSPGPRHRLRRTTRRRRSHSRCAPRPGAGGGPRRSASATTAVIDELMAVNAMFRLRSAQGILGLAARPGVGPAGGSLRQGADRRRPHLPHHQGHPRRRHRNTHPHHHNRRRAYPGVPARTRRTPRLTR